MDHSYAQNRKAAFTEKQIGQVIQSFCNRVMVVEVNRDILMSASSLRTRYGFSFWDNLIVKSALSVNANILYSEDMQDNLVIEQRLTTSIP
uniref:hypothetical protein n=1 Tax=Hassallia byssoidea TaxID=482630 RepID=UPI001912C0DD|nr:hypothetical protein [Hassalia byssoidea]